MRLIDDADAKHRIIAFATGLHSTVLPVDTVMMLLTQVPTIDAVPVVRCRDCAHWNDDKRVCMSERNYIFFVTAPDFYCADGKRKEGAD